MIISMLTYLGVKLSHREGKNHQEMIFLTDTWCKENSFASMMQTIFPKYMTAQKGTRNCCFYIKLHDQILDLGSDTHVIPVGTIFT